MRQYQTPQFITVEDKVVGPFTMKQFAYVGTSIFLIIIANYFLTPFFFFVVSVPLLAFALGLAFIKIDRQPLPVVVKNGFLFMVRPRLYVWRQKIAEKKQQVQQPVEGPNISAIPKLSESKLSDLAWSLDMKGHERENEQDYGGLEISPSYKRDERT